MILQRAMYVYSRGVPVSFLLGSGIIGFKYITDKDYDRDKVIDGFVFTTGFSLFWPAAVVGSLAYRVKQVYWKYK